HFKTKKPNWSFFESWLNKPTFLYYCQLPMNFPPLFFFRNQKISDTSLGYSPKASCFWSSNFGVKIMSV
ncbi:hypothetical protein, partial [Vibrio vulnificus]|uniref:hypothetical protein n=1 Tax=Vibrio vulnificus TaxID=672 RepID=UPI0019D4602F